jgi:hypothetical protein
MAWELLSAPPMSKTSLSRRRFLLGAGGAALALPLLEGELGNARAAEIPKRVVFFMHEAGTLPTEWRPTTNSGSLQLSNILSPLEPYKKDLVTVGGLWNAALWTYKGSWDNHSGAKGTLLTGKDGPGGPLDGNGNAYGSGISVDRVLADRMPKTARKTLDIVAGHNNTGYQGVFSLTGPNQPVTSRFNDPAKLYADLVGLVPKNDNTAAKTNARRASILDAVRENFASYRKQLGGEDRARLDAHAEYVRAIEQRLNVGVAAGCVAPTAPPAINYNTDHEGALKQHVDLLAMALSCDITRVVTLFPQTQQANNPGGISIPGGNWHNFLHGPAGSAEVTATRRSVFRWHYQLLAHLLKKLKETPEGNGSLLDNTLVVAMSEFGTGSTHDWDQKNSPTRGLPVVLAGSLGGKIKTGRHVEQLGRSHNDLLVTLLQLFGHQDTTFGNPAFCTGPIKELLG